MHERAGLSYWSGQVLAEVEKVSHNFDPDPVHDLRVALRRCRSMADGFLPVDPDRGWKQLKKAGKELFSRLGNLRDMQVMEEWVTRLGEPENPIRRNLLALFSSQEAQLKDDALAAVLAFDQNHWQTLSDRLAERTRAIPIEGLVFQHMAVERWCQAHELHRQALRNRSQVSLHRLRIGLKKFRYLVENFLPQRHAKWGADLKELQDLLGEIHDLDVLAGVLRVRRSLNADDRRQWNAKIHKERQERLEKYREKMLGRHALWPVWREGLPEGNRLEEAAMARLRTWAEFLDPDVQHSRHVTQLALELYDGLVRDRVFRSSPKQRRILEAAALLHDVGAVNGGHSHHKDSCRLIQKIPAPLGWRSADLRAIAAIARYHRGALPRPEHKCLRYIPASARPGIMRLAGVLRLANAFDGSHQRKIRSVHPERNDGLVIIHTDGYAADDPSAERIAAARHLLEATCHIAVVARPSGEPQNIRTQQ
ncbi:MAG TPA: CHAD domain-containing protein [Terriglobales bacterium]|nr:CHAD domain-containing protein [Terriglobales bacterium]